MAKRTFVIEETTMHHSRYEIEAESAEEAERLFLADYQNAEIVEEFWGDTTREVKEKS